MDKDTESRLVTRPAESFLSPLEQKAMAATGVMTSMMEAKNEVTGESFMMPMGICTATAFKRRGNTYYFITAAHCAGIAGPLQSDMFSSDDPNYGFIRVMPWKWYIDLGESNSIAVVHEAKLYCIGHTELGDDFAVFKVKLNKPIPTIPLALWNPRIGEPVINVAAPSQLGKQLFKGYVSRETSFSKNEDARDSVLLQLPCAPGSSGSSVISRSQKGIIAILTGAISVPAVSTDGEEHFIQIATVALPVSRFVKFWELADKGKYPYPAFVPMYFQKWMLGFEDEPESKGGREGCPKSGEENKPPGPFGEGEDELSEPPMESQDMPPADEIPE